VVSELDHRPSAYWLVVRTHPRQERRAEENLRFGNIETFLPQMPAPRSRRSRKVQFGTPLFPQYLFARFDPHVRLHDVCFTRGVQTVLRVGTSLATVGNEVIAFLRSREDANGFIRVGEPLQVGEMVTIKEGCFAAVVGVLERVLPAKGRVEVLLTGLQTAVRVEIASDFVRRLELPPM
jgi:transcriptional antiterminator RfaH